jgi:predicted ATP-dependent endonuclease of OLD family
MQYRRFFINHYRAIKNTIVTLNGNLIPIIGVNESGKTSILHAILSFDKRKDDYIIEKVGGEHLDSNNMYEFDKKQEQCVVKAEVNFESEDEINSICDEIGVSHADSLKLDLINLFKESRTILVTRIISTDSEKRKYSIEGLTVAPELNEKLAESIVIRTPPIIYFNDVHLTDTKEQITFPAGYLGEKWRPGNSKQKDWRALLEQIFYDATEQQYTLKDFIESDTQKTKNDIRRAVEQLLNTEIIEKWEKLKSKGQGLSGDDNTTKLEITLDYTHVPNEPNDKIYQFTFKVIDRSKSKAGKEFNVLSRSKGFKWFFNFIFKLKYNSDYLDTPGRAIFLLDEPGSFLHSSAQEGLLEQLRENSERNTIVFCTHSQYFLNPEKININGVKIVNKIDGVVEVKNFNETGVAKFEGAWAPLYHALQLNTGIHIFEHSKLIFGVSKVVITEGITDFYFFDMIQQHTNHIADKSIKFIPGAGAGQLKDLISIAIASSDVYLVLLDSDDAGKKAYTQYVKYFLDEQKDNFYKYQSASKTDNFTLEDFLSEADQNNIKKITTAIDVKHSIISLYFMEKDKQKDFISKLDANSISNLSLVFSRLNQLAIKAAT